MTEAPPRNGRLSRAPPPGTDARPARASPAAAMHDIAERAGVSKPVLYQHFPGKLELYRALLTTYADELVDRVQHAIGGTIDNQERVDAAVAAYFDFVAGEGQA